MEIKQYMWSLLVLISEISHHVTCRGRRRGGDDPQPKSANDIESKDPQTIGFYRSQSPKNMSGAYTNFPLGIFEEYYPRHYLQYINTKNYDMMQRNLNNGSLVCANYDVNNNGTYFGLFTCPLPFEPDDYIYCCGLQYAEICCYDTEEFKHVSMVGSLVFAAIVITLLAMGVLCWGILGQGWFRTAKPFMENGDF